MFDEMHGAERESVRGVCSEVSSLMIELARIQCEFLSSFCLADKHDRVPGKRVICLPNNVRRT